MCQILKEVCYNKTDNLPETSERYLEGAVLIQQPSRLKIKNKNWNVIKDVNLMTVIKEPTGFYYFTRIWLYTFGLTMCHFHSSHWLGPTIYTFWKQHEFPGLPCSTR
jgi:hypothetical protein